MVDFLCNFDKFNIFGGKFFKGVLFVGFFGIGKIFLVWVVVGEVGVFFFFMFGSEFDEIYVGVGVKCVCEFFNVVKVKFFFIVFIDELDVIGGKCNFCDVIYVW